jgi:hypothetical protein
MGAGHLPSGLAETVNLNQCMNDHGLRYYILYQPADRFWLFQGIEAGLLHEKGSGITLPIISQRDELERSGIKLPPIISIVPLFLPLKIPAGWCDWAPEHTDR